MGLSVSVQPHAATTFLSTSWGNGKVSITAAARRSLRRSFQKWPPSLQPALPIPGNGTQITDAVLWIRSCLGAFDERLRHTVCLIPRAHVRSRPLRPPRHPKCGLRSLCSLVYRLLFAGAASASSSSPPASCTCRLVTARVHPGGRIQTAPWQSSVHVFLFFISFSPGRPCTLVQLQGLMRRKKK